MRIPIKVLKEIAKKYNLSHVILFAHHPEDKTDHVVTFGKSVNDCSQAADFGNLLKDVLGWPKKLHAQPSRVQKLQEENEQLKKRVAELESDLYKIVNI
jgi:hypothetical protein